MVRLAVLYNLHLLDLTLRSLAHAPAPKILALPLGSDVVDDATQLTRGSSSA